MFGLMVFDALFGIGIPTAHPGDWGDASVWAGVLCIASIPLLGFFYGFLRWKIRKRGVQPEMPSFEPTATTKPCSYCGRGNDLEAAHCWECGTPFLNREHDQNGLKPESVAL
jgi:hypothetical protein